MRERLALQFMHMLKMPETPPSGSPDHEPDHYYRPALKSDWPSLSWWAVVQVFALAVLILFTFKPSFSFLPVFITEHYQELESLFNYNPFEFLIDWDMPILPWLGFGAEFLTTFPVYFLRLNIRSRTYFTDERGLGSREGIWSIREKYTFWENVQSITLKRNILQGLLGLSNIEITVAGAEKKEKKEKQRAITFRNLEGGDEVYRLLQERAGIAREQVAVVPPKQAPRLDAARALLDEVRGLKEQLSAPGISA